MLKSRSLFDVSSHLMFHGTLFSALDLVTYFNEFSGRAHSACGEKYITQPWLHQSTVRASTAQKKIIFQSSGPSIINRPPNNFKH